MRDAADIVASQMTEAEHLEQVKAVALTCGWRLYHTFDSRRSAAGFPDLVLVRPPRVIFAELKRENGRLTIPQKLWGDDLEQCSGVDYYLWLRHRRCLGVRRPSVAQAVLGQHLGGAAMSRKPYKFTAPRKALALKLISEGKTRSAAMESVGLARQTLTMAMKRDPEFDYR